MKFVSMLLLLGLIAGGVLYADKMGLIRLPEMPRSSQPEVRVRLPEALRQLSPEQKLAKALDMLREGKPELSLELYRTVVETAGNPEIEAEALFFWASTLSQSLNQPAKARQLYQWLIGTYPQSRFADNAHYNLGMLSFETGNLKQAVYQFTYLIENYPQSERLEDAKLMARSVSQRLTQTSFPLSVLMDLLPNNLLSLLTFLTAIGAPLVLTLLGYLESPQRWEALKQSTIIKVLLMLFIILMVANYFLNKRQSQQETQQLLQLLRQSGIDVESLR